MGTGDRRLSVEVPADRDLPDCARALADRGGLRVGVPILEQFTIGVGGDEMVCERTEFVDPSRAADRDADRHSALRQVPDPGGVHLEELAAIVDKFAGVQCPDNLDRLAEHPLAVEDTRPSLPDDVFVEVLPGAQSENEPAFGEQLHGGCLLRHDRRVVPDGRAGHVGHQLDAAGGVGHRAEH